MDDQIQSIKRQIFELPVTSGGKRKYPSTVKAAVCELNAQGMALPLIAKNTGIHLTTLHYWFCPPKSKRGFKEIKIKAESEKPSQSTIEIHFNSGARVLGLRTIDIVELLKKELLR